MADEKKPNQPHSIFYYFIMTLFVVTLLNSIIMPMINKQLTTQVDYGTFLSKIESGQIKSVEVQETMIAFTETEDDGKDHVYITGRMDDPNLVTRLHTAKVKFEQIIPKENSPFLNFLLTWIFPIIIFYFLFQLLMSRMGGKFGGGMSMGKSTAKVYVETASGKTFANVAGQDEAKEALMEIVDFLHNPTKYTDIGAHVPKGVLLVGPPGTGKTLMAQAVAGEANVPFFSISGSEFVEMYVGMGAARVRDLFKQAQEKAPCIVFIDEIDAIGKSRSAGGMMGGNDEREQTLNQLLTEMDGFNADKGVVILAATNRPESLDKALLRPGRFDRRIPLELPDIKGREAILKVHIAKVKLADGINLNTIARATPGASGADLANIINEAALRAVRNNRKEIIHSDLEESVEVVIAGYQRKNAVIAPQDKKTIAYHEIGHALVSAQQTGSAPVHKITIIPRTSGTLGYTMQIEEGDRVLMSREQLLNKITTYMGGRAAEDIINNQSTTGAANDIEQATKIARAMVTRYGMSSEFGMMALETGGNAYLGGDSSLMVSNETATKIDTAVQKIIADCYENAKTVLNANIDKLHELSLYLLEAETITGEQFLAVLNSNKQSEKDDANEVHSPQ